MNFLSQAEWDEYQQVVDDFHEDAFQEDIIWICQINKTQPYGEDGQEVSCSKTIKGLVSYNYFRSWPTNKQTEQGEIDKESVLLYLNNSYLATNGWINANGQFEFNPGLDRFEIRGVSYSATGDAQVSQINNKPLLHFIILKREEIATGTKVY